MTLQRPKNCQIMQEENCLSFQDPCAQVCGRSRDTQPVEVFGTKPLTGMQWKPNWISGGSEWSSSAKAGMLHVLVRCGLSLSICGCYAKAAPPAQVEIAGRVH